MNLRLLAKALHIPPPPSPLSLCPLPYPHLPSSLTSSSPLAAILFLLLLSLMPTSSIAQEGVDPQTTLGCHVRTYQFRVNKPTLSTSAGDILTCSGLVTVDACWGRCGSSEVGTYEMPYRISNHRVCTYTSTVTRRVLLSDCQGYPDPYIDVFDAEDCSCQYCNSDHTSCERLD